MAVAGDVRRLGGTLILGITYRGRKKGMAIQASSLDFDLDDLKAKQGRKKFTYRDQNGAARELLVDTDEVLEAVTMADPPGPV